MAQIIESLGMQEVAEVRSTRENKRAELWLSAGVLAVGVGAAAVTATLPSEGGYAGIGPEFHARPGLLRLDRPGRVAAVRGADRRRRSTAPHDATFQGRSFLWVSAGLFAHLALIGWAGFVIAGTVLFMCVARGFGSRRYLRDLAVGVALALAVYLFFTQVLNVNLPAGWMPFTP